MRTGSPPTKVGKWTEQALRVLRERYLTREGNAVKETPEQMCWRVATAIARAEERWGKSPAVVEEIAHAFYDLMVEGQFLPNSPTLMNAGKGNSLQYSACYVLPVGDSMDEIFDAVKDAAIIHKCLASDTLVMAGGLARLADVQAGALVGTDDGPFHVSDRHDNGEQSVFEVRTNRGYRIVGTAEHRLLAVAEDGCYRWRRIGELRDGDWLVMQPGPWIGGETKLPAFELEQKSARNRTSFRAAAYSLPREITPELAELVGLYVGDGSNHRDGIRFTVGGDSPEIVRRIEALSIALFGKRATVSRCARDNAFEVAILSRQIKEWFAFLGFTKPSSREACVPERILKGTEEVACAFARGLFTTDGCIRTNGHLTLTTSSPRLGEELQVMLLALGIPTQRRKDVSSTAYESYQVSVCTKAGFQRFREKIGFISQTKAARLAAVLDEAIFVRGEKVPHQRARLRAWYDSLPVGPRGQAKRVFDDLLNRIAAPRELTRQRITAAMRGSAPYPPFFEGLAREEFFFVQVSAIRSGGTRRVYDLTVPGKHAYVANGFVSHNSGGGTGFAFSRLRPKDALVASTGGKASGPVSFLRVFNAATEAVKQGGTRRGANMGILKVDHPDILEFIECKLDGGITNFNISVAATDRFMEALAQGEEYELIDPHTKEVTGRLDARQVFERIVQAAWQTGDPGMVFIDRINASPANPTPEVGMVEATNPCGEQPLLPNEACNLGSVNVSKFATQQPNGEWAIDWTELERVVRLAVRFLDDVIEVNPYPLPVIDDTVKANRRIGLGVMGWADLLFRMGIPYDSQAALDLGERLMAFIQEKAHDQSAKLAEERGPFPNWYRSIYKHQRSLRNSTVTTIAPTGTISMIAGCSSGVEPAFAIAFTHKVGDRVLPFINHVFEHVTRERGFHSEALMEEIARRGVVHELAGVPEDVQRVFVTAHEVAFEWHVRHQAAFQRSTDNGVSKTINLPNSATVEDVARAYLVAWQLGCLGITVFRDGCKEGVLHVGTKVGEAGAATPAPAAVPAAVKPRPRSLAGRTYRVETPLGTAYVVVNENGSGEPFEVFVSVGKAGSDTMAVAEAMGRLVSLILRMPSPFTPTRRLEEIVSQLAGIGGGRPLGFGPQRVLSLPDGIARVLAEHVGQPGGEAAPAAAVPAVKATKAIAGDICPECGQATFVYEEGCKKCYGCGFNEC
jgi:ribonucleoside-diphosphate reductase alpha chain